MQNADTCRHTHISNPKSKLMILYHHTAPEYLRSIVENGLTRGDVPLTPTTAMRAVWLTTDPSPEGHGLSDGRLLTPTERAWYERITGEDVPLNASFADKRRIRITIIIPSSDRSL